MIILNSVSKEIGRGRFKTLLLDDINWIVPPRCHIVILGRRDSGAKMLLDVLAGVTIPTRGWVDRRATVSVPGLLRYSRHETVRQLIARLSEVYRVDPKEIMDFAANAMQRHDVIDMPTKGLLPSLRRQLNMVLAYAYPCDFYLFNGPIVTGTRDFQDFCQRAFDLRSRQAGTIITTNSSRTARSFATDTMGGLLLGGKLLLYAKLADAITVFESVKRDEGPDFEQQQFPEQEVVQEEDELF